MSIIPKMINLNMFDNDILYSQGDQAEELFFMLKGNVLLYVDISELVDMSNYIQPDQCFNVALAVYSDGSYFGDSDII